MVAAAGLSVAMQQLTKSILFVKNKPPAVACFDDPSRAGRREMGRHDQCRGAGMLSRNSRRVAADCEGVTQKQLFQSGSAHCSG